VKRPPSPAKSKSVPKIEQPSFSRPALISTA